MAVESVYSTKEDEILGDYNKGSSNYQCENEYRQTTILSSGEHHSYPIAYGKVPHEKLNFHIPEPEDNSISKYHNLDRSRGISTPRLPPNTLAPPSDVTPAITSDLVRYPPPNTSAIYYDSLPEPKDEEFRYVMDEKEKRDEREEFVNVLRDKLLKIHLLTDVPYEKKEYKNGDNKDDDECGDDLIKLHLEPQSSPLVSLLKNNLSNLTEILSSLHSTESLSEDHTEETNNKKVRKINRSPSLKYDKTPPDQKQQSKKKIVKFADVFGMDLVEVRTFLACAPSVDWSSFSDLQVELPSSNKSRSLTPLFDSPITTANYKYRIHEQKTCLEQVFIGRDLSVRGIVRVLNITCEKRVIIRHTFDNWKNYHETHAAYLCGSSDGSTDQFSFLLWGEFLADDGILTFCICYQTAGGQEYWDNNQGQDYKIKCSAVPEHFTTQGSSRSRQHSTSLQQLPQIQSIQSRVLSF